MKALLLFLLLVVPINAQTNEKKPFGWRFYESSATFWAGSGAAFHSSFGGQEINPLFRDRHGRVSGKLYWGAKGGLYAVTVLLQKKYPHRMNWLRRVSGYIDFGFSAYNYQVKR